MRQITPSTIDDYSLPELNEGLAAMCAPCIIPESQAKPLGFEDLEWTSAVIAQITSLRAYLMTLRIAMDVQVRGLKKSKSDPKYQLNLDKKKVIESYIDLLDVSFQGLSRQVTLYQMTQAELKML